MPTVSYTATLPSISVQIGPTPERQRMRLMSITLIVALDGQYEGRIPRVTKHPAISMQPPIATCAYDNNEFRFSQQFTQGRDDLLVPAFLTNSFSQNAAPIQCKRPCLFKRQCLYLKKLQRSRHASSEGATIT